MRSMSLSFHSGIDQKSLSFISLSTKCLLCLYLRLLSQIKGENKSLDILSVVRGSQSPLSVIWDNNSDKQDTAKRAKSGQFWALALKRIHSSNLTHLVLSDTMEKNLTLANDILQGSSETTGVKENSRGSQYAATPIMVQGRLMKSLKSTEQTHTCL